MTNKNPFRPDDEEAPDLSDPAERLRLIRATQEEMNEAITKIALGKGDEDPMDLVVEALSGVFTLLELCEAETECLVEGASL